MLGLCSQAHAATGRTEALHMRDHPVVAMTQTPTNKVVSLGHHIGTLPFGLRR